MDDVVLSRAISYEESVELIAESEIEHQVDMGHSILYVLIHPIYQRLTVLNSSLGECGCISL